MLNLLETIGRRMERLAPAAIWSPAYALARTFLALGTAGTLAATRSEALFHPVAGSVEPPHCAYASEISLFCVLPESWSLQLCQWLGVALLLVVASGWRPRLTALAHWWVSFSLQSSGAVVDGGDQVSAVLTLLLLPIALCDGRKWQWSPPREDVAPLARGCGALGSLMLIVQVAGLYFHTAVAKMGVTEWANGTALYYWMTDPTFGPPSWLTGFAHAVVLSAAGVLVLSWGTILLELALALAWAFPPSIRSRLLLMGLVFHSSIAVFMGLMSFSFAMTAALLLYLGSSAKVLQWSTFAALAGVRRRRWRPSLAAIRPRAVTDGGAPALAQGESASQP